METLQGMKDAVLVWKYLQIMHNSIICVLSCPIAIFIANMGYSIKSKNIDHNKSTTLYNHLEVEH